MTDATLFAIGVGVTFLFLAGAYMLARADLHVTASELDGKQTANTPSPPA